MARKNGNPTITDVARVAGVSVSTVSRVLNGKGDVSPHASSAVYQALATTSYTASPVARSLVGGRTRLLGLCAQQATQDYTAAVISGVLETGEAAGYGVLWFSPNLGHPSPETSLLRTLPDGLVVVSPTIDSESQFAVLDSQRPLVFIEPWAGNDEQISVTATNQDGMAEITRYLLDLSHRRIGFITGKLSLSSSHERLAGFKTTMIEAGVSPSPELIQEGHYNQESGLLAARRLLALPERPTAIVASDDLEAFGVLWAAHEAELRVPHDLSVVGFDDVPMAAHVHPALTTVHQPLREMGRRATELLIEWIEVSRPEPGRHVLPTSLVVRESCGPPSSLPNAKTSLGGRATRKPMRSMQSWPMTGPRTSGGRASGPGRRTEQDPSRLRGVVPSSRGAEAHRSPDE